MDGWDGASDSPTPPSQTAAAYEAHDALVAEGVDTASAAYYAGIERAVQAQFSDRFPTLESLKTLQKARRRKKKVGGAW